MKLAHPARSGQFRTRPGAARRQAQEEGFMAKGYWVSCYRAIRDADALGAYAKLAGPAITEGGGTFLARGGRIEAFEAGVKERTVIVEFPSFEQGTGCKAYIASL